MPKSLLPFSPEGSTRPPASWPRKTWSPEAMAFQCCQSSHFGSHDGANSATVVMTQPELYLEATDMAPCSKPSQNDKRFPEHLGLWFECSPPPGEWGQNDFLLSLFSPQEGKPLLESCLRVTFCGCYSVTLFWKPILFKVCDRCQKKERRVRRPFWKRVQCATSGQLIQRWMSLNLQGSGSRCSQCIRTLAVVWLHGAAVITQFIFVAASKSFKSILVESQNNCKIIL